MLTESDREWLAQAHPGLRSDNVVVSGIIAFRATYNTEANLFTFSSDDAHDDVSGEVLSVSFDIRIIERKEVLHSALPAVHVGGVDPTINRHFCQQDHSACLCSPFEENEYLLPRFKFRRFLEELVVPFLYGQAFYTKEQRWPWAELAHGAMGILESYRSSSNRQTFEKCLEHLRRDVKVWRRLLSVLQQGTHLRGNIRCLCGSKNRIGTCHPKALEGVIRIRRDMREFDLVFRLPAGKEK
jgi:hypothetical protein